mgnify:FL=1
MKITNTVWHWKWKETLNEAKNVGGEAKYFPYIEELRAFDELPNELTPEQRWEDPRPPTRGAAMQSLLIRLRAEGDVQKLGTGAYRTVYGFKDNPDVILKLARGTGMHNKMNKDDAMLFTKYPLIAPRTYAHADDYKWIYIDNVEVAIDDIAYNNAIHDTFPRISKYIVDHKQADGSVPINPYDASDLMYVIAMAASQLSRADREPVPGDLSVRSAAAWIKEHLKVFADIGSPAFIELVKAMTEFNISSAELDMGNLGYNKDGRLIIIDSSIFED